MFFIVCGVNISPLISIIIFALDFRIFLVAPKVKMQKGHNKISNKKNREKRQNYKNIF